MPLASLQPTAPAQSWRALFVSGLTPPEIRAAFPGEDASHWIAAVLASGMADAQLRLGQMLLTGEGLAQDRRAAFICFLAAARAGDPQARNMLGRCHENGWGTPVDRAAARHCYKEAAEAGDYHGAHNHAFTLAADGCIAGALRWFAAALDGAPPATRVQMLKALASHPRCAIRAFAHRQGAAAA